MKNKRFLSGLLAAAAVLTSFAFAVPTAAAKDDHKYSPEYQSSPFYAKLNAALDDSRDKTAMEKTLAVALSQEGYQNYATEGIDVEQARSDGLLWTGTSLRMNANQTGNTEYTRWAQRYIMDRDESTQYLDCDWCAIFVSWCLYQAGYNDDERLKRYYYSYYAEPRIEFDADSWIMAYNFRQQGVYYTPKAHHKLDSYNWNTYYHVDVDPFDIPYQPGGLLFFSWDASGQWFDHVAIVVDYDEETHLLTYTNGNSDGQVITRQIDLDTEEAFRGKAFAKNSDRIMAYVAYDAVLPLEQKPLSADQTVIDWNRKGTSGIKIQTDSESVIASVSADGTYLGSNIESNMLLLAGLLSIGRSELYHLSLGTHQLLLTFDDGALPLTLHVYEPYVIGDADGDGLVTIADATLMQCVLAEAEPDADGTIARRCDVDGGGLSISDVTAVQRKLAEYSDPYHIGETAKDYGGFHPEEYELSPVG